MYKVIFIVVALFAATISVCAQKQTSLSGKITDQKSGVPLPGVSVYFPDLHVGTVTDISGLYHIKDLPKMEVMVEISFIGYKHLAEPVDLSTISTKDFVMNEAATELNEVVVTGLSKSAQRNRTSSPIMVITPVQLKQMGTVNIIDALATQPGISQITTGAGISKPVIRGLGYNRVLIVNDGIRQEGQQWGDEHGLEIDEYGVSRVEILKGPASLAYGSDALAGVINFLPAPVLPEGTIRGNFLTNFQTNNGLFGGSLNLGGNQEGIVWDVRYSNKAAHAYKNKYDGYVFNSGFKENNFGGMIGISKSWGYSHLNFSMYNLTPGIVEGERDTITGQFVKSISGINGAEDEVIATEADFKSYNSFVPYQKIHHYKLVSTNNFIFGNSALKTIIGWQQNQRQEYEEVLDPKEYGLYFYMNTLNYDARYSLTTKNYINLSFGANGMYQNSLNKGVEFLIPDYNLFDIGVFALAKKSWYKWTSGNAHLYGGEIAINIHPFSLDWLHFDNSFSYVHSVQVNQPDSMRYLPLTPAPKLHSELRATANKLGGNLKNAYVKIGVDKYFKQNYFYEAFGTETATPGYTLLNAGLGADVSSKKKVLFSIYISANNLTNIAYQSHLSRLKYLDENNATGRKDVFNMGRNFSFKLIVPIDIK